MAIPRGEQIYSRIPVPLWGGEGGRNLRGVEGGAGQCPQGRYEYLRPHSPQTPINRKGREIP